MLAFGMPFAFAGSQSSRGRSVAWMSVLNRRVAAKSPSFPQGNDFIAKNQSI
jgi:hypothetical protein